jgi:ABC-2 type transport system ATP-binding protein
MATVIASGLTKSYDGIRALESVDLRVDEGELRGLLGPNGAGKTTLLRILLGLVAPDGGTVELLGHPIDGSHPGSLEGVAGFVEEPSFYPYLTARANLEVLAELDGAGARGRIGEALERAGLTGRAGDRVGGYSSGMRQRLGIAAALMRSPRLLLLDEPTTGLDPGSRNEVWDGIREMSWAGTDIVLTTQYLDEADHLASSIVIIDGGRVIAQGTPDELKSRVGADMVELHTVDLPTMHRAAEVLGSLGMAEPATDPATRRCSIAAPGGSRLLPIVVRALDEAAVPVEDIALRRPTLNEVFLALTGHTTTDTTPKEDAA